ncbi:hypothetical protein NUKP71_25960 [Klebsiella quasipneumoniae]|nr:hypothetical protein NUKP71_25960 [Klebsiella quasipneumoniae]
MRRHRRAHLSEKRFREIDSIFGHGQRTTEKKGAQFSTNAPVQDTGACGLSSARRRRLPGREKGR